MSWYDVLGISYDADEKTIKKAYSTLIKSVHHDDDPERYIQIKDAYVAARKFIKSQKQGVSHFNVEVDEPQVETEINGSNSKSNYLMNKGMDIEYQQQENPSVSYIDLFMCFYNDLNKRASIDEWTKFIDELDIKNTIEFNQNITNIIKEYHAVPKEVLEYLMDTYTLSNISSEVNLLIYENHNYSFGCIDGLSREENISYHDDIINAFKYIFFNETEKALECYIRAIKLNSTDCSVLRHAMYCANELYEDEKLKSLLSDFKSVGGEQETYDMYDSELKYREGKFEESSKILENLLRKDYKNRFVLKYLLRAYDKLGDTKSLERLTPNNKLGYSDSLVDLITCSDTEKKYLRNKQYKYWKSYIHNNLFGQPIGKLIYVSAFILLYVFIKFLLSISNSSNNYELLVIIMIMLILRKTIKVLSKTQ